MDRVSIAISRVAMFLVAVIVAIIFFEVVMRYLFEKPTLWVNEMSLWLAGVASSCWPGSTSCSSAAISRIFILYDMVPRVAALFDLISTVLICRLRRRRGVGRLQRSLDKRLMRWETFGTAWDPPIPATMKPADADHSGADRTAVGHKSHRRLGAQGEGNPRNCRAMFPTTWLTI